MKSDQHLDLAVGHLDAAMAHLGLERDVITREQGSAMVDGTNAHMIDTKSQMSNEIETIEACLTALKKRFPVVRNENPEGV